MELLCGSGLCFILPLIWITCGLITAAIESGRGRSGFGGFLLGAFLGPFGIVISAVQPAEFKVCPYCKGHIHPQAQVCQFCGKSLVAKPA